MFEVGAHVSVCVCGLACVRLCEIVCMYVYFYSNMYVPQIYSIPVSNSVQESSLFFDQPARNLKGERGREYGWAQSPIEIA